mmetsp:Transcript_38663/g.109334  ORF Transcript_38663/g.109334 Transcript_38663/m.109334 type:complete len:579 (+) Transcript_38663:539-2275(+)
MNASSQLQAMTTPPPWAAGAAGGCGRASWSPRPFLPAAAASLFAAAAVALALSPSASGHHSCLADSNREGKPRGAGEADYREAVSMVERLWEEVKQELAQEQQLVPEARGRAAPSGVPRVRLLGDQLAVQLALRRGADLSLVMLECALALSPQDADLPGRQSSLLVRVSESGAARVLSLAPSANPVPVEGGSHPKDRTEPEQHMQVFVPLVAAKEETHSPTVEWFKRGPLDAQDIKALRRVVKAANTLPRPELLGQVMGRDAEALGREVVPLPGRKRLDQQDSTSHGDGGGFGSPEAEQAADRLRSMGAQVFPPGASGGHKVMWGELAGYEAQKSVIEDTLLLALQQPEVYESIARRTRASFASNRPRAVLFEGPPGTGKTTSGRIIASQASVPMVYVPLESVMSKYYGESEKLLAEVFRASETMGGALIFLDEVDSLATTRGADMHEATRRVLGVLLRQLDGFDSSKRSVVIAATNRKQDLDPALLSRFDATVVFDLPDEASRAKILARYAQHLSEEELDALATCTKGMSGRDLRDICEQTERAWASKIIRREVGEDALPRVSDYRHMCDRRQQERR